MGACLVELFATAHEIGTSVATISAILAEMSATLTMEGAHLGSSLASLGRSGTYLPSRDALLAG
jgi:hypothetical protein